MDGVRYEMNPRFEEDMAVDTATVDVLHEFAQDSLEAFIAAVPEATGIWGEKAYVDGAELGTTSSLWALFEYGSENNAPFAPFRRAAESVGLDLTDDTR